MLREQAMITAFLICVCTAGAFAGGAPPSDGAEVPKELDILLTGPSCDKVTKVWVVMDGAEQAMHPATWDSPKPCHWKAFGVPSFVAAWTSFSLRLDKARTGCKHAEPHMANGKVAATLTFQCCGFPTHDIEITMPRRIPLAYTRSMGKDAGDPESDRCGDDRGIYESSPVPILSVWFPDEALQLPANTRFNPDGEPVEEVRIKFGERDLIKRPPLMILNDASVTKLINPKDNMLTAEGIRKAEREQLARAKLSSSPEIVPNTDDYQWGLLKKIGLDRIKVTVAK